MRKIQNILIAWKEAYLCKTSDRNNLGREQYRKTLLDICDKRGDALADEVRIRLNDVRALSDLHAADARYHEKCRKTFTNYRNIAGAVTVELAKEPVEKALTDLIESMIADKTKTWTSVELQDKYIQNGGIWLSRRKLVENVKKNLKDDIIVFWSRGQTSLIVFTNHANVKMRVKPVTKDEEEDMSEKELLKIIAKIEVQEISEGKKKYLNRISLQLAKKEVSPTFSSCSP